MVGWSGSRVNGTVTRELHIFGEPSQARIIKVDYRKSRYSKISYIWKAIKINLI